MVKDSMKRIILTPAGETPGAVAGDSREAVGKFADATYDRVALRAIITDDASRLLMIHSPVNGDYKFPGGGAEPGEDHLDALAREVREETGYSGLEVADELLHADETRSAGDGSGFRMFSRYFRCALHGVPESLQLDAYEAELGFTPRWVSLSDALSVNRALLDAGAGDRIPWLERELRVLDLLARREIPW